MLQAPEQRGLPLQPVEQTMVRQAVPLQPMEHPTLEHVDAQRRLQPHGEPALERGPHKTCGPMETGAHAEADLLVGLVTPWGTHAGAVREELQPTGRTHVEEICGGLSPMGGTPRWRKERQRQRVMN